MALIGIGLSILPLMQTLSISYSQMNLAKYLSENLFMSLPLKSTMAEFSRASRVSPGRTGCLRATLSNFGVSNMFLRRRRRLCLISPRSWNRRFGSSCNNLTNIIDISFERMRCFTKKGTSYTLPLGDCSCNFCSAIYFEILCEGA